MDSLNLTHREAMYLLDHVGADKDIITLRLSTTEREEIKSTFPRIPRAGASSRDLGRKGEWEERDVRRNPVINDFTHSSFGNFGGMGNKGEREDFQSPSSGGALF